MFHLFKIIKENRFLIRTWVKYNFQADYIDTKLGIFWIILQPIFQTLIYTLVFGTLIGRNPRGGVPFILFFLAGISTWQFINNNWMQSGSIIVKNVSLMSQVKISAESLVIIQLIESLVEFGINFVILIIFALFFGYFPTSTYLLLPIIFLIIILTTLGGMFFISSLGVFIRDIPKIIGMLLRPLFYLSGIIITPDMLPENIRVYLTLNPLLLMIEAVRDLVIYDQIPNLQTFLYTASFSVLIFIIGYSHFRKRKGIFVDYQ